MASSSRRVAASSGSSSLRKKAARSRYGKVVAGLALTFVAIAVTLLVLSFGGTGGGGLWTHSSFDHVHFAHPANLPLPPPPINSNEARLRTTQPVCHLPAPCLLPDGTWILKTWMRSMKREISRCGLGYPIYALNDYGDFDGGRSSMGDFVVGPTLHWDVVAGGKMAGDQGAIDVATAVIGVAHALTAALGNDTAPTQWSWEHKCVSAGDAAAGSPPSPVCTKGHFAQSRLAEPVILMDDMPRAAAPFSVRIFSSMPHISRLALKREIFAGNDGSTAVCFRSLLASAIPLSQYPPNGAASRALLPNVNHSPLSQANRTTLFIANPGSRISDAPAFEGEMKRLAAAVMRTQSLRVRVSSDLAGWEDAIVEAAVVIAPHGDWNAAVLKMRPGSVLVELLPFGVRDSGVRLIAQAIGVRYASAMAQPDYDGFKRCIARGAVSRQTAYVVGEYSEAMAGYSMGPIGENSTDLLSADRRAGTNPRLPLLRECLMSQKLAFELDKLVDILKERLSVLA